MRAFLRWWGGSLAQLVPPALRRMFRPCRAELRAHIEDELMLEHRHGRQTRALGSLALLAPGERERLAQQIRRGRLDAGLTLPGAMIGQQTIRLPAAAARELDRVLGFEIDRLTPFQRDEIYFAGRITDTDRAQGTIGVELAYAPRAQVDPYLTQLREAGLAPAWASPDAEDGTRRLNLLPHRPSRRWTPGRVLAACLLLTVLGLAGALWLRAEGVRAERIASLEAEIAGLRRDLLAEAGDAPSPTAQAAAAAYEAKTAAVPVILLLADLTDLLPDGTALATLEYDEDLLRLSGESDDPARLIGIFEAAEGFQDPAFDAPITRDGAGGRSTFLLSVRVRGVAP